MKKIAKLLFLSTVITFFSSCSFIGEKNTIGLKTYYDDSTMTCRVGVMSGFNMEEIVIPNYMEVKDKSYKVVGIYIDNNTNDYFLKNNKYIKKVIVENDFITTFPYDIFRNSSLEEIDLSKATNLKNIGDHAFESSSLKTIKMGPQITKLYKGVFSRTKLTSITFPDTLEDIDINTFFDCKKLEYCNLGNKIIDIDGSTFESTPLLKEVVAPSVKTIQNYAFKNAKKLETFNFDNISYIGEYAFENTALKEVNLKDVTLKSSAFEGSLLEKVTITNCDNIEYKSFGECLNLKDVSLNGSIYKIGSNAFRKTKIEKINIPDTVAFIGSEAFKDCSLLNKVHLPEELISISLEAFKNCSSLSNIEFPSKLERIYSGAFINTALTSVNISKNVEIYDGAFSSSVNINLI